MVGGEVEDVTGAVINPGQYLDVGPLGEPVVGEVGLPGFVGHCLVPGLMEVLDSPKVDED